MAATRSKFDWASLDRTGLVNFLWYLAPKIIDNQISVVKFHNLIAKHLRSHIPLRIAKSTDKTSDPNMILVGGCYYSDWDQEHRVSIEVLIVYNPQDKYLNINKRKFWRICHVIADTILHEVIHMRQYRRRKFKYLPEYSSTAKKTKQKQEQEYLGCSDEIDAYGFNIACELLDKFSNDRIKIREYLDLDQKNLQRRYSVWRMYLKAFNHDHNHNIIKRLKKKIMRYLPNAEIGKPYRNKDWINY